MIPLPGDDGVFEERLGPLVLASRILIADQRPLNLEVIGAYLRNAGFTNLDMATDGAMALEKVRAQPPDLLILDFIMPRMNGFEVCRALRAERTLANLPVLAVTALDRLQDRIEIFRAGATDLIAKPVNRLELIARVAAHLERRHLISGLRRSGERIERELQAARDMLLDMLPSTARVEEELTTHGLETASVFSTSSELGGDLWGILNIRSGHPGIYLADFTGHGVMAALNAVRLHTLVEELPASSNDPGEFLGALNAHLVALLPAGQFATMICVCFDLSRGCLSYAAAGSPAPLLRAANGGWKMLDSAGVPLGIAPNAVYPTRTEPFARGALLFLYSDALAETPLADGSRLGEAGVATLATAAPTRSAKAFLDHTIERFCSSMAGALSDDLTCVAMRNAGASAARAAPTGGP